MNIQVNFNKSAYDRNTAKLAAGAGTSELEPVMTVVLDASAFEAEIIEGKADNDNLNKVERRSPTAAAKSVLSTLHTANMIPQNVYDMLSGGEDSEQREQHLRDIAKNAANDYTKTCAANLMKAAQEASQPTAQTSPTPQASQANKAGGKLLEIIRQKFAGVTNLVKQSWSKSGESTRSVLPEEVGVELTGDFGQSVTSESPTPSSSSQTTGADILAGLGNVFVRETPVSVQKQECNINLPDEPITDTPADTQEKLNAEAER